MNSDMTTPADTPVAFQQTLWRYRSQEIYKNTRGSDRSKTTAGQAPLTRASHTCRVTDEGTPYYG